MALPNNPTAAELVKEFKKLETEVIQEIPTQDIRITDLDTGVYKLTYEGTKRLFYNGATSTSSINIRGGTASVILNVNKVDNTYWNWYYINALTNAPSIFFGGTSATSGTQSNKALGSLLTEISTYVQNNLNWSTNNSYYALSAYQGYVLNQNKVDKVSTANRVYGTDDSGNQTTLALANASNVGNAVAKYDTAGRLKANTPSANDDVANKAYVEAYVDNSFSFHDVTVDDVSVVDAQLDAATIYTINQDYDVSTNRLATEADLPDISGKQDTLVSGTNIKTINNESILGSGNITISGGGSATDVQVDGTSITYGGVANIATINADYNASTNPLATESDIDDVVHFDPTQASVTEATLLDNYYTKSEVYSKSQIDSRGLYSGELTNNYTYSGIGETGSKNIYINGSTSTTLFTVVTQGRPVMVAGKVFATFTNMWNANLYIVIDSIEYQLFNTNNSTEGIFPFFKVIPLSAGSHSMRFRVKGNNDSNATTMNINPWDTSDFVVCEL